MCVRICVCVCVCVCVFVYVCMCVCVMCVAGSNVSIHQNCNLGEFDLLTVKDNATLGRAHVSEGGGEGRGEEVHEGAGTHVHHPFPPQMAPVTPLFPPLPSPDQAILHGEGHNDPQAHQNQQRVQRTPQVPDRARHQPP